MIKHRFNVPRPTIEATRRELNSARFRESLRLRETLGYIGDRQQRRYRRYTGNASDNGR